MNTNIDSSLTPSLWRTYRALANLRHLQLWLAKLERRGFVSVLNESVTLIRPRSSLAKTLLAVAEATPLEQL